MGSYKRSKYVVDTFRNYFIWKIPAKHPRQCASAILCLDDKAKRFDFPLYSANFQKLGFSSSVSPAYNHNYQHNPFRVGGSKRFYSVDLLQNFGLNAGLGTAAIIALYFRCQETVPFSQRTRFLLSSRYLENILGKLKVWVMKGDYEGKILPAGHPQSTRVRLLTQEIIDSLQRGFGIEKIWNDVRYVSSNNDNLMELVEAKEGKEDKYAAVQLNKSKKSAYSHLEGLNWEVMVIDDPQVNAECYAGGKIFVYTGLLKHLGSDAEIACVLGHEVGHVVARHPIEGRIWSLWSRILPLVACEHYLICEIEADSIGMLLYAGAGYDPRSCPKTLDKLGDVFFREEPTDLGLQFQKKRSRLMRRGEVMEKALEIYYKAAKEGRHIKGFL